MFLLAATILAAILLVRLYTPTCYDGDRNGNEMRIDCGGSCPPCAEPPNPNETEKELDAGTENTVESDISKVDKEEPSTETPLSKPTAVKVKPNTPQAPNQQSLSGDNPSSLTDKCVRTPEININGELKCGEPIIFTSNLPADCNLEWNLGYGKLSDSSIVNTFGEGNYTVELYVGGSTYSKDFKIKCNVIELEDGHPSTPNIVDNCINQSVEIKMDGKFECGKSIAFTSNLPPDCNPIWYFENEPKSGYEVTHTFDSGRYSVQLYVGNRLLKETRLFITCPLPLPPTEPTCNDNIQNGNEKGIDCGGDCPRCPIIMEPNDRLKEDLQNIADAINSGGLIRKRKRLREIVEADNMCREEDTQVIANGNGYTIENYIMNAINGNIIIENVRVEKNEECITQIVIQYSNR